MIYLSKNLKEFRLKNNLTQEDVAEYLNITPQSVSKWERGETYPDITLLPALANIFETSIDMLIGMDTIRAEETIYNIHNEAHKLMQSSEYNSAELIYRDALISYPKNSEILFGLASTLSLQKKYFEAIDLIEKGLKNSNNQKQISTMRALLCFLYLIIRNSNKALGLANTLPHIRESREVIVPFINNRPNEEDIYNQINYIILG